MLSLPRTLLLSCVFASLSLAGPAHAVSVQPMVANLQAGPGVQSSAALSVHNDGAGRMPVEISVSKLVLGENGEQQITPVKDDDIIVFPPAALIEAGARQTFRMQYAGDPEIKSSQTYFVSVKQVPVKVPEGKTTLQMVYNFNILVTVAPVDSETKISLRSASIGKNDKGQPIPVIQLENAGNKHGYLSEMNVLIRQRDANGKEVFSKTFDASWIGTSMGVGIVQPGRKRNFKFPAVLPSASGTLTAELTYVGPQK